MKKKKQIDGSHDAMMSSHAVMLVAPLLSVNGNTVSLDATVTLQ